MRIRGEESKLGNAANPAFFIFNFQFSISPILYVHELSGLKQIPSGGVEDHQSTSGGAGGTMFSSMPISCGI